MKKVLFYKRPAFWFTLAGICALIVLALCILADPVKDEDMPPAVESAQELIPGESFVSSNCLYMTPFSSYSAFAGDSGYRYIIGEGSFTIASRDGGATVLTPESWGWQPFPYTDEEWKALFMADAGDERISEVYTDMLCQPLDKNRSLFLMDGQLWLAQINEDNKLGAYMWSLYSLVSEREMGSAQWQLRVLSSQLPAFPIRFDMDYTEIRATCTDGGELVDFDTEGELKPDDSGVEVSFEKGHLLYWTPPIYGEGVAAGSTVAIRFTVYNENDIVCSGTVYVSADPDDAMLYTASPVGAGLCMAQDEERGGGVISLKTGDFS